MSGSSESSASVQKQVEDERAQLVSTLDQLRQNLRPSNVIDEVMAETKIDASVISDTMWRTVRANPIPATLIGLGAAMLLGVGSKAAIGGKGSSSKTESVKTDVPKGIAGVRQPIWDEGSPAKIPAFADARNRVLRSLDVAANQATSSVRKISESADALRSQAMRRFDTNPRSARLGRNPPSGEARMNYSLKSRSTGITASLTTLLDEQPLVLAALGIAVGAAIGAALPTTEVEGRYLGEASGNVKQTAQDLAQEQYRHLKATASDTLQDLKQTAADHGVSSDNLSGLVQDLGGKVRDAANDVVGHAAEATGNKS